MNNDFPQTLADAIVYFSNPQTAFDFMVKLRWPDGVVKCPRCQSTDVGFISTRKTWECRCCTSRKQFSVKVGTIFEDSALGLHKWLAAVWLIANAKNGVSSYEVHRAIGVTQKTGWFMLHRIRLAPFQRFQALAKGLVRVPKAELDRKIRDERARKNRRNSTSRKGAK